VGTLKYKNNKAKLTNFILSPCSSAPDANQAKTQAKIHIEPQLSESKKVFITNKLCNMIINRSLPVDFITSDELKEYTAALNPQYCLPTSAAFVNTLVPALVERAKIKMRGLISQIEHLNITTDIWTDETMKSYIAFTGHGITSDFQKLDVLLSVKSIHGNYSYS
jgi:hypothetical protein